MSCLDVRGFFDAYLRGELPPAWAARIRQHLDHCERCWQSWNRLRWNRAASTPLYAELVEYLGDRFVPFLDSSRALGTAWERAAPQTTDEIRRFYRDTDAYLYNQVIWHASGNRPNYVEAALPILDAHPDTLIVDYGCGIGEDLLAFHHAGRRTIGCDLPSPPTDFLAWRAPRHHYRQPVLSPDRLPTFQGSVIVWIMDALDHLPDLDAALGHVLPHTELLVCEDLLVTRGHGRQGFHYRRPLSTIERWLARYRLARVQPSTCTPLLTVWRSHAT